MKKKIISIIIAIIILAGITTLIIFGFNKDLNYKDSTLLEIYIENEFSKSDILNIAKESFTGSEIKLLDIELVGNIVGVQLNKYEQEQLDNFITKLNEKYEIEYTLENINIIEMPAKNILNQIENYILPIGISIFLIITYNLIIYRKLGIFKVLLNTIVIILLSQIIYVSLIIITRMQINDFTIPIGMLILIFTILSQEIFYNKKIKMIK